MKLERFLLAATLFLNLSCARIFVKNEEPKTIQFSESWLHGGAYYEIDSTDVPQVWVRVSNQNGYNVAGKLEATLYADSTLKTPLAIKTAKFVDGIEETVETPRDSIESIPSHSVRYAWTQPKINWKKYTTLWVVWKLVSPSFEKSIVSEPSMVRRQ